MTNSKFPTENELTPEPLTLVGVLKDVTETSVQFSTGNFTDWLPLPTALIEEATLLGVLTENKASQGKMYPLYSISFVEPQTQMEHFFFNLIVPPFIHAAKNSDWNDARLKLSAAAEADLARLAAKRKIFTQQVYRKR